MTLIITVIKGNTIWQSSDNRVSTVKMQNGLPVSQPVFRDDNSIKHVTIECPNGMALLAWTGLAELPDIGKTKMSDWVAEILRGENRDLNTTLEQIRVSASKEISNSAFLLFSVGAFLDGEPYYYEITNGDGEDWQTKPLRKNFTRFTKAITKPEVHIGGGAMRHISRGDQELLRRILKVSGEPRDFENILARINRNTSHHCNFCSETVSPSCVTVYIQSMENPLVRTATIHPSGSNSENPPIPYVILGVDIAEYMRGMMELFKLPEGNIGSNEFKNIDKVAIKKAITPRPRKP